MPLFWARYCAALAQGSLVFGSKNRFHPRLADRKNFHGRFFVTSQDAVDLRRCIYSSQAKAIWQRSAARRSTTACRCRTLRARPTGRSKRIEAKLDRGKNEAVVT